MKGTETTAMRTAFRPSSRRQSNDGSSQTAPMIPVRRATAASATKTETARRRARGVHRTSLATGSRVGGNVGETEIVVVETGDPIEVVGGEVRTSGRLRELNELGFVIDIR